MATERAERPYSGFRFRVEWDGLDSTSLQAGFQEVSGLGMEVGVAEYRNGNAMTNEVVKITTLTKTPDVTFKRGVIGDLATLYEWLDSARNGSQATRNITIELLDETGESVAQTWRLMNARPMKYEGPTLNGAGGEIAIEGLTVASERITQA